MPHFQSQKNIAISTNLKVMYSSLKAQSSLRKMRRIAFIWMITKEKIGISKKKKHYLLVRHPYTRLASFFKNKLRKSVTDDNKWQPSQRIFFLLLNISKKDSPKAIQAKLKAVTFEQFIEWLPELYQKNRHLYPQFWIEYLNMNGFNGQVTFDKICPIENQEELIEIANELELDLSIRENSTNDTNLEISWTPKLKAIVQEIYKEDFERYGYAR